MEKCRFTKSLRTGMEGSAAFILEKQIFSSAQIATTLGSGRYAEQKPIGQTFSMRNIRNWYVSIATHNYWFAIQYPQIDQGLLSVLTGGVSYAETPGNLGPCFTVILDGGLGGICVVCHRPGPGCPVRKTATDLPVGFETFCITAPPKASTVNSRYRHINRPLPYCD